MATSPLNLQNPFPISSPPSSSSSSSSSSYSSLYTLHFKTLKFLPIPKPPINPNFPSPPISRHKTPIQLSTTSQNSPDPEPDYPLSDENEAREAVREYLVQVGASTEDADHISSNCPNYLKMLIDGVKDIDDWNSLVANSGAENVENGGEWRRKVYRMAEEKGDKGVLPFLESIGLSLSSATYLARYVSSSSRGNTLPVLVGKVKYVKEIFFSGSDDSGIIGKNARRMMAHLSISSDEDLQKTLAFFEKVQARRGGLINLGFEHASLRYLIESFPHLLTLPLESRVKPLLKFLDDIGVPEGRVRNILLLFPPILSYDVDKDIRQRLRLYEKVGSRETDLGKMLVKYPWILSSSILVNFDKIVNFFDEEKVPRICSSNAIRNGPHLLGCSVDKLRLVVEHFGELSIANKKLGQVIAKSPQLLLRRPQEFIQMVSFFKELGLDEEAITRTIGRCPEIFAANIDKTLKRKLEFLSDIGISKTRLPRVIRKYPELFVCDVDRALLPRMRYLMKVGLSKYDIGSMVCRFSPLLGYSIEEVLRPKLEFLVNTMGKSIRDVVEYPRYFSYSLEKKIKPRYWVLKSRNIEFNLKEMLGKNDDEFATEYMGVGEMLVPPP